MFIYLVALEEVEMVVKWTLLFTCTTGQETQLAVYKNRQRKLCFSVCSKMYNLES